MRKSFNIKNVELTFRTSHHWNCHWKNGGYIIFLGCETGIFNRARPSLGRSFELTILNFSVHFEYFVQAQK
jgi:hypothetical protein